MTDRAHQREDSYAGPPAFCMEALPAPEGVLLLRLEGELDVATTPRFRTEVQRALEAGTKAVIVDLEEVTFMDSSMLKELLRAHSQLSHRGGLLVLAAVQSAVQRLLELTRTSELLHLAATREEALALTGA
jgi:stage II sporulation protein AA (anti-sigma F factor antagonist)